MHFKIFEKNLHYQGKKGGLYEPREGMVLDLNGDHLDDLVFLVHDRLLLYKQIGNAVPVNLGYAIARSLVKLLNDIKGADLTKKVSRITEDGQVEFRFT